MAAYTIIKSDGSVLTTIPEGTINTTACSIALPGKNFSGYGLYVDTDLVHTVEHFADSTAPAAPMTGQIWADTTTPGSPLMKYYTGSAWNLFAAQGGNATFGNLTVTGNTASANFNGGNYFGNNMSLAGNISAGGNISGGNLGITGNIAAGNISVLPSGNIDAANFNGGNFSGTFRSPGVNTQIIFNDGGNLGANTGLTYNKTTDTLTAGNLTVLGTTTTVNSTTLNVVDPIITMGGGPNGAPLTANDGKDRGSNLAYYDTSAKSAFMGYDNSANSMLIAIDVSIAGEIVTVNSLGNITLGNISATGLTLPPGAPFITNNITTGAPANPGTITGTWTLTPGSSLQATYADLAERHEADAEYPEGTVVKVGGEKEITQCMGKNELDNILGVVSRKYAYLMNAEAGPDSTHPAVAYVGRVPVRILGPITKGQKIMPIGDGCATASMNGQGFGWALESSEVIEEKLVLCVIK